ncbi:MAG: PEP/pyruvate-binding domain-containing protein [Bacteroidota bacterium]
MAARLLLSLRARKAGDPEIVGGKASGLNTLLRHGFPVPPGFCLLPASAMNISFRGLPPDFRHDVARAFRRLGGLVAVRSSPPDRTGASRPLSILGVNCEEAAVRAVARCMSCRQDEPQIHGKRHKPAGESGQDASFAVVVQRLVDAIVSGVAYSRNPQTGDETEIFIQARWGIGQECSSESNCPDLFRLRKYPLSLLAKEPAAKTQEVRAGPVGLVRRPLPQARRMVPVLTDDQALRLAGLVRRIEERVGFAVEVEWALSSSGFQFLALHAAPRPAEDPFYISPETGGGYGETIGGLNALELPTGVVSPFTWDLVSRAADALLHPLLLQAGMRQVTKTPPLVLLAGRIYLNATNFRTMTEKALGLSEGSLAALFGAGDGVSPAEHPLLKLRLALRLAPRLRFLLRCRGRLAPERIQTTLGEVLDECVRLDRILAEDLTPGMLVKVLEAVDAFLLGRLDYLLAIQYESRRFRRWLRRLRRWCGPGGDVMAHKLVAGLGEQDGAGAGYALWRLARMVKNEPVSPDGFRAETVENTSNPPLSPAIREFLHGHGHLCADALNLAVPRWGDDPASLLEELRLLALLPEDEDPGDFLRARAAARGEAEVWLDGRLSSGGRQMFFWRRRALRLFHARLATVYPLLTEIRAAIAKLLWRYRRILILAGRQLSDRGLIPRPEDVFLLRLEEITSLLSGRADAGAIGRRREHRAGAQARYQTLAPPVTIKGPYSLAQFATPVAIQAKTLRGLGVSPGKARGVARLVHTAAQASRVLPGEIVVARNADQGWAPVILRAGAAVFELGNCLCEGAVLARAYGRPAVVRAGGATAAIKDGDLIEVDGDSGLIELVASQATLGAREGTSA